jgi:PKD repeat protein
MTRYRPVFSVSAILTAFAAAFAGVPQPASAQDTAYAVDAVAVTGEPAPGTGGLNFECIDPLSIDLGDSGIASFVGWSASCFTYDSIEDHDQGVWVGTPGNLVLAARMGDPAPGGIARSFTQLYGAFVDDSGDLALHASTAATALDLENGVWVRSAGNLSALAMTGEIAPGTGGRVFTDIGPGGFSDLGAYTFLASAGDFGDRLEGIWSGAPGSLESVVLSGDPAPGTAGFGFEYFSYLSIDEAFTAFMAMTTNPDPNREIGIWTAGPTGINLAVRVGDELPGAAGRVLRGFYGDEVTPPQTPPAGDEPYAYRTDAYVVSQTGEVAFTAYVDALDPADIYSDAGIWTRNASGLNLAALTGEIAPGTASDPFLYFNHVNINSSGQVAFDASLDIADTTRDHGIWAGSPGNIGLVVREGDPAPGTAGETFGNLVMGPNLSDSGAIVFFARLSESGTDGLWAAAADGSLSLIALEGESVQVKSGDYRTIQSIKPIEGGRGAYFVFSGFNNAGQQAFMATFADGMDALLLASPASTSPNQPPVANAGPDQTVVEGQTIALDGSGSSDPEKTVMSFVWSVDGVEIATGPTPAVGGFAPGTHTVTLTVTDRSGATASDDMILTVFANLPPVADAGPDQTVQTLDSVTLNGSGSSDPENDIKFYTWSIDGTLLNASGPTPVVGPFDAGVYTITLTVSDGGGSEAIDQMVLTVLNRAPVADAGPNRTANHAQTVTLGGTGSDPEGGTLGYAWTLNGAQIASVANPTVGPFEVGSHTLTFTVTDDKGTAATDSMILTVTNAPPIASAGPDQTVNHAQAVLVDGSGSSDPESGLLSHIWSIGGVQVATGASASLDPLEVGVHTITLTVTDDHGATATDSMVVTVINEAPVANAGPDQTVAVKGKTALVMLDGSASSDPEGRVLSYFWTRDGQTVGTTASVELRLAAGVHAFTLTVTDYHGAMAADSIVVTATKGNKGS